ncbi:MAG: hypothetical protein WKG01_37505, partial [Kofleriaceae bacterium]
GVILSESERMAGIVKKIGKITKYETTDYVGSARMLDLERAAPESNPAIPIPIPADESQTGEFHAVSTPLIDLDSLPRDQPTHGDLVDLADLADGGKR